MKIDGIMVACRVRAMQAGLSQPGSTWYVLKLSSMSTIMREWSALHAVQDLRFKDVLLSAKKSTSRRTSKLMVPQVECSSACCALPVLLHPHVVKHGSWTGSCPKIGVSFLHGVPACVDFLCMLVFTMCK